MNRTSSLLCFAIVLAACGDDGAPAANTEAAGDAQLQQTTPSTDNAAANKDRFAGNTRKMEPPVRVNYRVIGEPIVGQPVAIDLQLDTNLGSETLDLAYRINDTTALQFPEAQPLAVAISPTPGNGDRGLAAQQVTVIPMREGRLFLNVAAKMQTDTGSMQTVTAIPLQVGAAPRQLEQNGAVTTDANGELIRDMPASEN